jgi:hypothetical protein
VFLSGKAERPIKNRQVFSSRANFAEWFAFFDQAFVQLVKPPHKL